MKISALTILFLLWINLIVFGQEDVGRFKSYGISDGLSQSTVVQVFQDRKGFIWMGTTDGLNRFDGKTFIAYKNKHNNPNSLSDNWIVRILLEDSENNLWILTSDRAINKFNIRTNHFQRFYPNTKDSTGLQPFNMLYSMEEDTFKNVWLTTNSGIFKFLNNTDSVVNYCNEIPFLQHKSDLAIHAFKDSEGIIWFSSAIGLCKYNYHTNSFIRYSEKNGKGLTSLNIIKLIQDKQNNLWALTDNGLNLYNRSTDTFKFFAFPGNFKFYRDTKFHATLADLNDNIWIGSNSGLMKFSIKQKSYTIFTHTALESSISDNRVTRLLESKTGYIWIGTFYGLNKFDFETSTFERYFQQPGSFADNFIFEINELRGGEIWVNGVYDKSGGGYLSKVNFRNKYLQAFTNNPNNPKSISCSLVFGPLVDNTGNLWLGSFGEGAVKYTPRVNNFRHYPNATNGEINYSSVWGFSEDTYGNIWTALYDQGFSKLDTLKNIFINYKPIVKIDGKQVNYTVMSVCADNENRIWVATMEAGLLCFDPKTGKTKSYVNDPCNPKSISSNLIRVMTKNNSDELLLVYPQHGIDIFNTKTETVTHLLNDPPNKNSLPSNSAWYIIQDKSRNYWISTEGFISYYNTKTGTYKNYKSGSSEGIIADKALSIFESSTGTIWFGSSGGGFSGFNPKTGKFTHFTEDEGLVNNVVYGILEDEQGFLWLSTNKGVSKFNPKDNTFQNFDESAGLQSNEFNVGAFYKSRNNLMYIGGINGFNVFNPSKIMCDTIAPPTVITGFQEYNRNIPVITSEKAKNGLPWDDHLIVDTAGYFLPANIAYQKHLILPYQVKVFTFEFAALLYNAPEKCTFRYKMENFDEDWNYSGTRNFATYTNLPPGSYTFRVMAANPDGIWNSKSTDLKITIVPPFWKTWWFFTLVGLFIFGIVSLYIVVRERNLRRSKAFLEEKVKQRTKLIEEKNEELKLRNIEISKQKEEIDFQARQLKSELAHQNQASEVALLRSQVNPHFLFNTLNNIYSLVNQKSDDAPEAIMKLSEIMRYMLYEATSDVVPLEKEINYLKSFIELQILRLRNRECVDFNITGNIYGKSIAPMLFIPFIENAFKHGIKNTKNPCIIINLALNGHSILFDIENLYQKQETSNKDVTGGIGLTNVRRRLELLHPNSHNLKIDNTNGKFRVTLELSLNEN